MAYEPDLSSVPTYQTFFEDHKSYERYHIHLIGVQPTSSGVIKKGRNLFGRPRLVDAVADPYVSVETVGSDTGSTDFFPIGSHKFPVLEDCQSPLWDAKCLLIAKKGSTDGIEFKMFDKNNNAADEELFGFTLKRSEMPKTTLLKDSTWTEFSKTSTTGKRTQDMVFCFHIMVTDGTDQVVTKEATEALYEDTASFTYTEEVLKEDGDENPEDNALLQCWRQNDSDGTKAVIWILGRNDTFMHSHVVKRLLFESKYDLYVLNYKQNGHCRKRGWVADAHFNSHNKYGTFDCYIHDIDSALKVMSDYRNYETVLGYAHSTGGPVLLNYLIEQGDEAFDGFIFNSPFLDWGFVGGDMVEFVLEHMGMLSHFGAMTSDTKVGIAATPAAFKDTPITYLGAEIVLSAWAARLWSMYFYDGSTRPLYEVPMTVGFANGVTGVHEKLEKLHKSKRAVTSKPFLCITSRGDDVLKAPETLSRADWIGPGRWEVELNDNSHDVFLSMDEADTDMAIEMVKTWMTHKRF